MLTRATYRHGDIQVYSHMETEVSHRHTDGYIQCYFLSLREREEEPWVPSSSLPTYFSFSYENFLCRGLDLLHILLPWAMAFLVSNTRPLGIASYPFQTCRDFYPQPSREVIRG